MSDNAYFLEMIRQLEKADYFDSHAIKHATATAKDADGKGFEKLLVRAKTLDTDGEIWQSLMRAKRTLSLFEKGVMLLYFVFGLVAGVGLLVSQKVNFFYLLVLLLGWHSISLLMWCVRPKNGIVGIVGMLVEKFWRNKMSDGSLDAYAYQVLYTAQKPNLPWWASLLIHKNWLCGLIGNTLALFGLFLVKNYQFFWESTILPHSVFETLIKTLGFVPSLFGFDLTQIDARTLALLILISLILYGIVPRALACLYTFFRVRAFNFDIDKSLYYYENLLYTFSQLVVDKDDYVAPKPKPVQARVSKDKKAVASLERAINEMAWYQYGAGANVEDVGVIDEPDDFARLERTVAVSEAQVYLGIDKAILPDRGVVRKLEKIAQIARFGLVVELWGDGDYGESWQVVLAERNIGELRR